MEKFNALVSTQMQTMEKLLYVQAELERCLEIEKQLDALQQNAKIEELRTEIQQKKEDLREIYKIFERQTEELIHTYQDLAGSYR